MILIGGSFLNGKIDVKLPIFLEQFFLLLLTINADAKAVFILNAKAQTLTATRQIQY